MVVDRLLDSLIPEGGYSSHIMDFLHGTWKLVLCNTYLTQGKSSKYWGNLKKISSMLCWSLQVRNSVEEKRMLVESLPSLLKALSRGMDLVQLNSEQKEEFFKILVIEHAKIIRQSLETETTDIDNNRVSPKKNMSDTELAYGTGSICGNEVDIILSKEIVGEAQVVDINTLNILDSSNVNKGEELSSDYVIRSMDDFSTSVEEGEIRFNDDELIELVMQQVSLANEESSEISIPDEQTQSLRIGTWVNFDTSDTIHKVGELFWKSKVTGRCVFLNKQGKKIMTISESDLNVELKSGIAELTRSRV